MKLYDYFELLAFSRLKDDLPFKEVKRSSDEWERGEGFAKIKSEDEIVYKFKHEGYRYELVLDREGSPVEGAWEFSFSANDSGDVVTNLKDTETLFRKIKECLKDSKIKKFSFIGVETKKESKWSRPNQLSSREKMYMRALKAVGIKVKTAKTGDMYFEVD